METYRSRPETRQDKISSHEPSRITNSCELVDKNKRRYTIAEPTDVS